MDAEELVAYLNRFTREQRTDIWRRLEAHLLALQAHEDDLIYEYNCRDLPPEHTPEGNPNFHMLKESSPASFVVDLEFNELVGIVGGGAIAASASFQDKKDEEPQPCVLTLLPKYGTPNEPYLMASINDENQMLIGRREHHEAYAHCEHLWNLGMVPSLDSKGLLTTNMAGVSAIAPRCADDRRHPLSPNTTVELLKVFGACAAPPAIDTPAGVFAPTLDHVVPCRQSEVDEAIKAVTSICVAPDYCLAAASMLSVGQFGRFSYKCHKAFRAQRFIRVMNEAAVEGMPEIPVFTKRPSVMARWQLAGLLFEDASIETITETLVSVKIEQVVIFQELDRIFKFFLISNKVPSYTQPQRFASAIRVIVWQTCRLYLMGPHQLSRLYTHILNRGFNSNRDAFKVFGEWPTKKLGGGVPR